MCSKFHVKFSGIFGRCRSPSQDVVMSPNIDDGGDGGDGSPGSPRYGGDGGDGSRLLPPDPDCCWQVTHPPPAATHPQGLSSHRAADPELVGLDSAAGNWTAMSGWEGVWGPLLPPRPWGWPSGARCNWWPGAECLAWRVSCRPAPRAKWSWGDRKPCSGHAYARVPARSLRSSAAASRACTSHLHRHRGPGSILHEIHSLHHVFGEAYPLVLCLFFMFRSSLDYSYGICKISLYILQTKSK